MVMGPIIPPSIFMVIMGVRTGVSIGGLFAAGVIPGILQCLAMMAMAYRGVPSMRLPFEHGR